MHDYPNDGELAHQGTVVANDEVAPGCWRLEIRVPEIAGRVQPGQFVMLRCRAGFSPLLSRAFSVCDVVSEAGAAVSIVILQHVIGVGTQALTERAVGETIGVLGPLGHAYDLGAADEHLVMLAGGIGAAPFLYVARHERARRPARRITYLVGARDRDHVYLDREIAALGCEVGVATDDGSQGHKGYVTDLLRPLLVPGVRVIACGPNPMFKSLARLVEEARAGGLDFPCQVSTEESMPCGYGACAGCVVPLRSDAHEDGYRYGKTCVEGPVFPVEAIRWDLIRSTH